jgi:hypothetical protein
MSIPTYFKPDYEKEHYIKFLDLEEALPENRDVLNDFLCALCGGVYHIPTITREGHVYCRDCVLKAIGDEEIAREKLKEGVVIQQSFKHFKVFCKNKSIGCEWIGPYFDLEAHMKIDCGFMLTQCDCKQEIYKNKKENHLNLECPTQFINCPYFYIGCSFRTTKHLIDTHLSENVSKHLKLFEESYSKKESEIKKLQSLNQENETKIKNLQNDLLNNKRGRGRKIKNSMESLKTVAISRNTRNKNKSNSNQHSFGHQSIEVNLISDSEGSVNHDKEEINKNSNSKPAFPDDIFDNVPTTPQPKRRGRKPGRKPKGQVNMEKEFLDNSKKNINNFIESRKKPFRDLVYEEKISSDSESDSEKDQDYIIDNEAMSIGEISLSLESVDLEGNNKREKPQKLYKSFKRKFRSENNKKNKLLENLKENFKGIEPPKNLNPFTGEPIEQSQQVEQTEQEERLEQVEGGENQINKMSSISSPNEIQYITNLNEFNCETPVNQQNTNPIPFKRKRGRPPKNRNPELNPSTNYVSQNRNKKKISKCGEKIFRKFTRENFEMSQNQDTNIFTHAEKKFSQELDMNKNGHVNDRDLDMMMEEELLDLDEDNFEQFPDEEIPEVESIPVNDPSSKETLDTVNISKGITVNGLTASCTMSNKQTHLFLFSNYKIEPDKNVSWKVTLLDYTYGWIAIGACIKEVIISNQYKFSSQNKDFYHGNFLISSNKFSWNANVPSENNLSLPDLPIFHKGMEIIISFDHEARTLNFKIKDYSLTLNNILTHPKKGVSLVPCVLFLNMGDTVEFQFLE